MVSLTVGDSKNHAPADDALDALRDATHPRGGNPSSMPVSGRWMVPRWLALYVVSTAMGCRPEPVQPTTHVAAVASPVDASPIDASQIDAALPRAEEPVVLAEWLSAHGAKGALDELGNECCCVELRVGTAREPAVQCDELDDVGVPDGYWAIVHRVVRVVRAGTIVKALDVPIQLGNMDRSPRPGRPWADFELELRIAADGMSATVDARDHHCAARTAKHEAEDAIDIAIRRMCAARGVYRWNGGRFRR
jgi:hypothetical protein